MLNTLPENTKLIEGGVCAPIGFFANGVSCGIKKNGRKDLALIYSRDKCVAAGVFTKNKVVAAPVKVTKSHINKNIHAILANSGNANACTGRNGLKVAKKSCELVAKALNIPESSVLVASTGIIGEELPISKISYGIDKIIKKIKESSSRNAAEAIMTTDTRVKEIAIEFGMDGKQVRIGGIAKGSGMIAPNLATMLAFITTDVNIERKLLSKMLKKCVDATFNKITVDGHTSTNDMVLVLANGKSDIPILKVDKSYHFFEEKLLYVCSYLARAIVKDGEGATKLIEIKVKRAKTKSAASAAARTVANSNLVKTALFGEDANWGRIMSAIGYSGISFRESLVSIKLNDLLLCKNGVDAGFDRMEARKILTKRDICIEIDLGMGREEDTILTTDLSYDYIKINAQYR